MPEKETTHYKLPFPTNAGETHKTGTYFEELANKLDALLYEHRFGSFTESIIATEQARENTSFGTLATPDEVEVVLPSAGLIVVAFQAQWKESANAVTRASLFLGSNQVKVAARGAPSTQEAEIWPSAEAVNKWYALSSFPLGLATSTYLTGGEYGGDVTTGQVVGVSGESSQVLYKIGTSAAELPESTGVGGPLYIFAAEGSYKLSVRYKTSTGKVSVKNRKLWAWVLA